MRLASPRLQASLVLGIALAPALILLGILLCGPPSDPDLPFHLDQRLGVFVLFAGFSCAVWGWGRLWSALLKLDEHGAFGALALGTMGASLSMMALGHLGLIGERLYWLHIGLLFIGPMLNFYVRDRVQAVKKASLGLPVCLLAGTAVLVQALNALIPQSHADPLFYGLAAPRWWFEAGRIAFRADLPLLYHASYWEGLYLWGCAIIGGSGPSGLIELQLFGQLVHVFFGFAASALALHALFRKMPLPAPWRALLLAAGLCAGSLLWAAPVAKNDWGLVFWALSGMALLLDAGPKERARLAFAGALFGAATAGKLPNAYSIVGFTAAWAVFGVQKSRTRALGIVLAAAACVAGAIWLRNAAATGDPIYPLFAGFFHSPAVGPSFEVFNRVFSVRAAGFTGTHLASVLLRVFVENPVVILLPASLVGLLSTARPRFSREERVLLAFAALTVALFALTVGEIYYWRYAGACTALLCAIAVVFAHRLFASFRKAPKWPGPAVVAVFLAAQILRAPQLVLPHGLFNDPAVVIRGQNGGDSKAWLRMNAREGEVTLSGYDPQIYYLSGHPVQLLEFDPALDAATFKAETPAEICEGLKSSPARYLLETWLDDARRLPWGRRMAILDGVMNRHPELTLFQGRQSRVVDFRKLCVFGRADKTKAAFGEESLVPVYAP